MLNQLTRRTVALFVGVFAALGFLAVPLGERTGFQHTRAVFTSKEAQNFARELKNATEGLRKRVLGELSSETSDARRPSR